MNAIHRTRKVALQVEEDKSSNVLASTTVHRVAEALDLPRSTVQKIMRNILRYYPYKLQFVQELLPHDFETRHLFSLQFLARLEVDPEWPLDRRSPLSFGRFARATIDLLKDTFDDRLISRFGPVNWHPRSCDLTPLDYFLWGYVKSLVYADKPPTLDRLEDNIRRVIADIRPQMLEKVIENWTSRLDYIRASRGHGSRVV
ncbi:transposable element Tc3 transposase [Trichonephila clavipes]|nr:transposable element Tc3 transposase [Trichonephila clavipes]